MSAQRYVSEIYKLGLCTQCGTCLAVCPYENIQFFRNENGDCTPRIIDEGNCKNCKLCYKLCPGISVDFDYLNAYIFGVPPSDGVLGNYINFYVGFSSSEDIRKKGSSGGVTTALLIHALKSKIINGAVVTRMNRENPLEPEVLIAKEEEEILSASQSKYFPVPVNVKLRELLAKGGKYAIVGLPCHIHGVRKAELLNKRLQKKIALRVGLFCGYNMRFLATLFLLRKLGVRNLSLVSEMRYREGGWPGGFFVKLKNGRKIFLPKSEYSYLNYLFPPIRCTLCPDQTNELADISIGDPWNIGLEGGWSSIITRTDVGEKILREAVKNDLIVTKRVTRTSVMKAQKAMLVYKKRGVHARMNLKRIFFGGSTPSFNNKHLMNRCNFSDYLGGIILYSNIKLMNRNFVRTLVRCSPPYLLRLYEAFISSLLSKGRV